jgi:hypothetical protein
VLLFGGLFTVDSRGAEQRVQQRKAIREAQIRAGDREVFVNEEGETMSKLKEVRCTADDVIGYINSTAHGGCIFPHTILGVTHARL